jgi:hypothetical protein
MVACLLESSVRSRIWQGIQTGRDRDSLQRMAASSPEPEVPAAAMDEPETEGSAIEPTEEGLVESERPGEHAPRLPVDGPEHPSRRPAGGDISGGTGGI